MPYPNRDEIITELCERIANGETLRALLRRPGMPHFTTVYDWIDGDAEVALRFERARAKGADAIAEEALEIIDEAPPMTPTGGTDSGHVQWARARADLRLKLLAKWHPKRYGDKLELAGNRESPIVVEVLNLGPDPTAG